MSEREFMDQVIDLAHVYGWIVAHFRVARTKDGWVTPVSADGAGFPDLIILREGRMIVAELKREDGNLTPEQYFWLLEFMKVTDDVYLWKESDWEEAKIVLTPTHKGETG